MEAKPPNAIKPKGAEGKRKMESIDSCIPKKSKQVGFSNKHCALCKKNGGPHKSHNTRDCCKYNADRTPIKWNGGAGSARKNRHHDKNRSNTRDHEGANYAQLIRKEVKKAIHKQLHIKNITQTTQKVTATQTTVSEAAGWIAQGN